MYIPHYHKSSKHVKKSRRNIKISPKSHKTTKRKDPPRDPLLDLTLKTPINMQDDTSTIQPAREMMRGAFFNLKKNFLVVLGHKGTSTWGWLFKC